MDKQYRIKDIARLSGVSTGTVDRILHKRGKVSSEAQAKVEKVLKEINYQPNLIARSLALKKTYTFLVLIPEVYEGGYWSILDKGIQTAERELFSYNIKVERLYFNQYDKSSFDSLIGTVLEKDYQGVIIATLFRESVLELTNKLSEKEVPYVLIDSYIENTGSLAYYGTHSYDSGYIAGRLLFAHLGKDEDIAIFRFVRKGELASTQVIKREEGFREYLKKKGYKGQIHSVHIHADDLQKTHLLLDEFFSSHPDVHHGIIFNSKAYVLGDYFKHSKKSNFRLIGYDILDANVRYLADGLITHLIGQRPEVQGVNCVKALFRHLILKEDIDSVNYMPIDVLMKENIKYYNNYI